MRPGTTSSKAFRSKTPHRGFKFRPMNHCFKISGQIEAREEAANVVDEVASVAVGSDHRARSEARGVDVGRLDEAVEQARGDELRHVIGEEDERAESGVVGQAGDRGERDDQRRQGCRRSSVSSL